MFFFFFYNFRTIVHSCEQKQLKNSSLINNIAISINNNKKIIIQIFLHILYYTCLINSFLLHWKKEFSFNLCDKKLHLRIYSVSTWFQQSITKYELRVRVSAYVFGTPRRVVKYHRKLSCRITRVRHTSRNTAPSSWQSFF